MPAPIAAEHSSAVVSSDVAVCSRSTYTASNPAAAAIIGMSAVRACVSAMQSTSSPGVDPLAHRGHFGHRSPSLPVGDRRHLDPTQRVLEDLGVALGRPSRPTRVTVSTSGDSARSAADRALLLRPGRERVELVVAHRVLVGDLATTCRRSRRRPAPRSRLGRVRPVGVGVRVVGLPAHVVDVELGRSARCRRRSLMKQQRMCSWKSSRRAASRPGTCAASTRVAVVDVLGPRQRKYGIHPMSPSVSENFSVGNRSQNVGPDQLAERGDRRSPTTAPSSRSAGASGDVGAPCDDEPTWQHSTVSVSHARGEQRIPEVGVDRRHLQRLGVLRERDRVARPCRRGGGPPSAASSASHIGRIPHGMNRSGYAPHHSSTCQSLYAWIITRLTSRSGPWFSTWPAKPVQFGKLSPASWPPAFMSRTRSCTSKQPGRISS